MELQPPAIPFDLNSIPSATASFKADYVVAPKTPHHMNLFFFSFSMCGERFSGFLMF